MKKIAFTLLLSSLSLSGVLAQQLNVAKLDSLFTVLEKKEKFFGSIAISQNQKEIFKRSIHKKNEKETSSTGDKKYRIGSISKIFTACLILKAQEENKLNLDQNLGTFFPGVKNAAKISIENLLNHRSGIHNITSNVDYLSYYTQPKTEEQLLKIIESSESDFEPGSKFEYSNSNYILLSMILQKVYGQSYKNLLQDKITQPLGLKNTYYGARIKTQEDECHSYMYKEIWTQEPETDMSIPMGAGAIVSSPADLNRFIELLYAKKIVNEKSLELMLNIKDGYGLGIRHQPMFGKDAYGHSGGIDGFTSALYYFPSDQLSIAITSNGCIYNTKAVLKAAVSSFYGIAFEIPTFETIALTQQELETYVGKYINKELPLEINIVKGSKGLIAQSPGQSALPLDATQPDIFEFPAAGIKLEFKKSDNKVILHQGGQSYVLVKN